MNRFFSKSPLNWTKCKRHLLQSNSWTNRSTRSLHNHLNMCRRASPSLCQWRKEEGSRNQKDKLQIDKDQRLQSRMKSMSQKIEFQTKSSAVALHPMRVVRYRLQNHRKYINRRSCLLRDLNLSVKLTKVLLKLLWSKRKTLLSGSRSFKKSEELRNGQISLMPHSCTWQIQLSSNSTETSHKSNSASSSACNHFLKVSKNQPSISTISAKSSKHLESNEHRTDRWMIIPTSSLRN